MSLTSEIRDAGSPLRAFLDGISAPLAATYGNAKTTATAAGSLGFPELIKLDVAVPLPEGVDATRTGTALDIRTRMALGQFDVMTSTSLRGLEAMIRDVDVMKNGVHRVKVLTEVFDIAQSMMSASPTEDDLDLASLLLAPPEQFYRASVNALAGSLGEALDTAHDGSAFVESLDPRAIEDIRNLRIANAGQITAWLNHIASDQPFEGNPSFIGSLLVGGADGDWLAGDTLIDCKVYSTLSVPKLREFLRQLLGYVMLDLDDTLKIRSVGVWLPRQVHMQSWSLEFLLGGDPEVLLPKLREEFVKATRYTQLAIHIPITERRRHQLVADNQFSPAAMLRTLAYSDDQDLRARIGRNQATPDDIIRLLAEDRLTKVRAGVAANQAVPIDVLTRLTKDPSVTVRRAAAQNPGGALAQGHVLTETSATPEHSIVLSSAQTDLTLGISPVQINQDRDPEAINYELLWKILNASSAQDRFSNHIAFLPEASRAFAWQTGRGPVVPKQLQGGLPIQVVESMFELSRPPVMRWMATQHLSIDEPEVRGRLLTDDVVDIRWDALQRSTHCVDDQMRALLAELALSREARVNFRTVGVSLREMWLLPTDYGDEVLTVIATHAAMPQDLLHALIDHKSPDVLLALASNPTLDLAGRDSLAQRMLSIRSSESRQLFAESRHSPAAVLERLARNRSLDMRLAVAGNPYAPDAALELLAEAKELAVRLAVVENQSAPSQLATAVAEQMLKTTADIRLLDALQACHRRSDLVLSNGLIEDALERLTKSRVRDPDPREYVAMDERTAQITLARLSRSADKHVRLAVAGNRNTSQEILSDLLLDDSLEVRIKAARVIEKAEDPDDSAETSATAVDLPSRPALSVEDLHEMVASKQAAVRKQAAYSRAATPDILTFLAGDRRSVVVRRIVAAHPTTPPATLNALSTEPDDQITQALAFNSATPDELLIELAGRSLDLALLVAVNPDAPDNILGALVDDDDLLVRHVAQAIAASRPALSVEPSDGWVKVLPASIHQSELE